MSKRLYDSVRWRRFAKMQLGREPLCRLCFQMGRDTAAAVVDHIVPHETDPKLFWDANNLQSLCPTCHNAKRTAENIGYSQAAGVDGIPIDQDHPWNRRKRE